MSDEINVPTSENLDDEFKQYAAKVALEETDRKNRSNYNYEEIKWLGLKKAEQGRRHIEVVRALGGVPNTNKTPYDARTVRIAEIICDDKRKRRFILPSYDDNKAYLFWRIINHVLEVEWGPDKKKTYPLETNHPAIFNMVKYNSFPAGTMNHKTTKGWTGQNMFLMNIIGRSIYSWHKENKHSALLSKEIREWTHPSKGTVIPFPVQGVPAYGFVQTIASELFAFYGHWKQYDIAIERTGTMNSPYRIINCDKNPEKLTEEAKKLAVTGPLTEEELSWKMYDLSRLFKVSSYAKWWNNLKNSIAAIDTALGTHYYAELKSLMEQEKKDREAKRKAGEIVDTSEDNDSGVDNLTNSSPPVIESRAPLKADNQSQSHYVDQLPSELKEQIESYGFDNHGKFYINYKGSPTLVTCTLCKTPSPKNFTQCPKCGVMF